MLTGTLQQDGRKWYIESVYSQFDRPVLTGTRWEVRDFTRRGAVCFAPEPAPGLPMTYGDSDQWSTYHQGGYLVAMTIHEGTVIPEQPIPQPKVRKGIEARYRNGRWEKYTKAHGWTAA